ncbi:MAG: hypothetical protein OEN50_09710 [Deltaproteobacteria bacterium]|nr:hypothetical protein [Deltaproteobacteria bacterium]
MDEIRIGKHRDQLIRRREKIVMTLRHLAKEQAEVERNTDWLDQAAYESRVQLLDRLNGWYVAEIEQIDNALARVEKNNYGLCVACNDPIENRRLDTAPESEFCSGCQSTWEYSKCA